MPDLLHALSAEFRYRRARTRLMRDSLSRRGEAVLTPTLVQLQTHNRCNGRCVFCPYPSTVASRPETWLDESLYARILREMATWPHRGVLVLAFQNEPLLDERVSAFVRQAKQALGDRWEVELTTNGELLDEGVATNLFNAGLDMLNVSLNALSADIRARLMPGLPLATAEAHVLRIAREPVRHPLCVRFVKTSANAAEYTEFRRRWRRRGVFVIGYDCNDRLGSVRDFDALRPLASRVRRALRRLAASALFRACPFPWSQVNILADGELRMCCHDYTGSTRMGNVARESIRDLFNGPDYGAVRAALLRRAPAAGEGAAQGCAAGCATCRFHREVLWL
jgi:MoaA/NifB/PqqE/SkfB family radical SAM enzyme